MNLTTCPRLREGRNTLQSSVELKQDPKLLSPLTLAFLGDAVFELLVRESLVSQGNRPSKQLHQLAVGKVCAVAQSQAYGLLEEQLNQEELAIRCV